MARFEGVFSPPSGRFAVICSRFNSMITEALLAGCLDGFQRHGVIEDQVDIVWVPGSFELPLVAKVMANSRRFVALVTLGCIIKGETDHYDHVAGQAASGIMSASLESGIPVIFGVLTTESVEQALNRAGLKAGNKGFEAATSAIEMANLFSNLKANQPSNELL